MKKACLTGAFKTRFNAYFSFLTESVEKYFITINGMGGVVTIFKNYVQIESTGPVREKIIPL